MKIVIAVILRMKTSATIWSILIYINIGYVLGEAIFNLKDPTQTVYEGGKIEFSCVSDADDPPDFRYELKRKGVVVGELDEMSYIPDVNDRNGFTIQCTAVTGDTTQQAEYEFERPAYISIGGSGNEQRKVSLNAIKTEPLSCDIDGYPEPTFYWSLPNILSTSKNISYSRHIIDTVSCIATVQGIEESLKITWKVKWYFSADGKYTTSTGQPDCTLTSEPLLLISVTWNIISLLIMAMIVIRFFYVKHGSKPNAAVKNPQGPTILAVPKNIDNVYDSLITQKPIRRSTHLSNKVQSEQHVYATMSEEQTPKPRSKRNSSTHHRSSAKK